MAVTSTGYWLDFTKRWGLGNRFQTNHTSAVEMPNFYAKNLFTPNGVIIIATLEISLDIDFCTIFCPLSC
jgi:hypothetical protein